MTNLIYKNIMWAEMSPDLYDGEDCDQIKPRWNICSDGDIGSELIDVIKLKSGHFPVGTKVTIAAPCCPNCGQGGESCETDELCDFDWGNWVECRYS